MCVCVCHGEGDGEGDVVCVMCHGDGEERMLLPQNLESKVMSVCVSQ